MGSFSGDVYRVFGEMLIVVEKWKATSFPSVVSGDETMNKNCIRA